MDTHHSATLHISRELPQVYRVLYTVSNGHGGATIPYRMQGQDQLKSSLTDLGLPSTEIAVIIARVETSMSYVLDLSHMDRPTAQGILDRFAQPLP